MSAVATKTAIPKKIVNILQIGTFLEYFDLMIYVHMAVLLNDLFFPKTDFRVVNLTASISFCSIYIFRPFGALIFGFVGDNIGRKPTIILTAILSAISCIVMANLPTYAQIGFTSTIIITICRIVQGVSSMGELVGSQIYLTELVKPPLRYPVVSLIDCATCFGTLMSLVIVNFILKIGLSWRIVFWLGAIIALVGVKGRIILQETPEFINAKAKLRQLNVDNRVNQKTSLAYFLIHCGTPLCFYFTYIYCGGMLKNLFDYTAEQIIQHNMIVSVIGFVTVIFFTYLSYKIHPLKITKITMTIFMIFAILVPYFLAKANTPFKIFLLQLVVGVFGLYGTPANAVFVAYFPIIKRFKYASVMRALSHMIIYVVTSFGFSYLLEKFGVIGIWFIIIPITIGFIFGILHFSKLEKLCILDK